MQFLLTQYELAVLTDTCAELTEKRQEVLQDLCCDVAEHKPAKFSGLVEEKPWGCLLRGTAKTCSRCLVENVCPNQNKVY